MTTLTITPGLLLKRVYNLIGPDLDLRLTVWLVPLVVRERAVPYPLGWSHLDDGQMEYFRDAPQNDR